MKKVSIIIITLFMFSDLSAQTHKIKNFVMGSSAQTVSNSNNKIFSTLGQAAIGKNQNAGNIVSSGFWYSFNTNPIVNQQIILTSGWNLISTFVEPVNKSMPTIWNDIKLSVNLVKNNIGQSYIPSFNINQIGNWNKYEGYQVSMKESKTLSISGSQIKPENTPISLTSGWKMVSYIRNSAMSAPTALATLTSQNALTLCKNSAGQSYIPQFNINQIGNLLPGQGYQMFLSKNATLTYPANSSGKATAGADNITPLPKILIPEYRITGNSSTLLVQHDSPNGNEIGVYNQNAMLIGSGVFHNGIAAVTIWGDDEQTEITDGAKINDELRIMNYDSKTGRFSEIELNNLIDIILDKPISSLTYSKDGFYLAKVRNTQNSNILSLVVSPNPASENIGIELSTSDCEGTELKIYSIEGKLICDLSDKLNNLKSSKITHNISNLTSGEYSIILTCGSERAMRKVVVVK
jgi:hypothetical protein